MIRKPLWWMAIYYIPFLGFIVWVGIIVELLKQFKILTFWEHALAVVFTPFYLAYVGHSDTYQYAGYEFVEKYKDKGEDQQIIGHFGLGFYSAFMVSKKVEIDTLSYQEGSVPAKLLCDGETEFEIKASKKKTRKPNFRIFWNGFK